MGTRAWLTAGVGFSAAVFAGLCYLWHPPAASALFALPMSAPRLAATAAAMTFVLAVVVDYGR